MPWSRWFYKATAGVEDFVEGADDDEITSRRNYVYWTIDHAPFQKWVVFVAGVGFFTDAYDIFALNVVLPVLDIVYWDGNIPRSYQTALICSTLAGTLIGQVLFGFLADKYGRRKMYGLELLIVISATIGVSMSATGAKGSMSIMGWLIFWRITSGIGIGADYPLSAVICSEFAPREHRARMLASVFFCQPIGQLLGMVVSLVVITASRKWIPTDSEICTTDECIRTLDSAWRWIVGFGSIPAVVALFFRLTIPESPRYLLDVAGQVKGAANDTREYYKGQAIGQSQELMEAGGYSQEHVQVEHPALNSSRQETPCPSPNTRPIEAGSEIAAPSPSPRLSAYLPANSLPSPMVADPQDDTQEHIQVEHPAFKSSRQETPCPSPNTRPIEAGSEIAAPSPSPRLSAYLPANSIPSPMVAHPHDDTGHNQPRAVTVRASSLVSSIHSAPPSPPSEQQPPKASWQDAHQFFIREKNWIYLFATSSTWFWLDFAFYGLGLSAPAISRNIWHDPDDESAKTVYHALVDNTTQSLVLVSIGTMVGSLLIIKAIKYWSSKAIQFYGFIALTILFITIGGAFTSLLNSEYKGIIIVLYVLCQVAFNLGPNTTTFLIPAEIFPTRYRCSAHGISAAAGKLGSIIGQLFVAYVRFPGQKPDDQRPLGWTLMILALFMAIGGVKTWYLVPETRDEKGKSMSLEVLARGRMKQPASSET